MERLVALDPFGLRLTLALVPEFQACHEAGRQV